MTPRHVGAYFPAGQASAAHMVNRPRNKDAAAAQLKSASTLFPWLASQPHFFRKLGARLSVAGCHHGIVVSQAPPLPILVRA